MNDRKWTTCQNKYFPRTSTQFSNKYTLKRKIPQIHTKGNNECSEFYETLMACAINFP